MPNRPHRTALSEHLLTEPLFKGVDPSALRRLAESASWRQYAAGEVVFLEGETAPGLYFLESGWLKIVMTSPEGREQVLLYLAPGEIFNPLGAFANRPNPATAIALEAAGVWLLSREAMGRLLRDWPDLAQRVIANMANRLVQLTTLVEDLSLRPVSGRLARLLLENATDDVLARPRWYTQAELAARLGTVPDMVGRALRRLVEQGYIAVERHQFRILDPAGLQRESSAER
jgi:CRP/FNR family transcriptional regulator